MVKTCITYEFIRLHLLWCFRLGEFPPPFLLIRIQRLSRLQKKSDISNLYPEQDFGKEK